MDSDTSATQSQIETSSSLVGRRFTVTNTAGSLGDWLSLTPLLKAKRDAGENPLVVALDSPHTRQFATLYQGVAEVEFVKGPIPPTPETDEPLCFAQRILRAHGLPNVSPIPVVEIAEGERQDAEGLLAHFAREHGTGLPGLVAFNPTVGAARSDLPDTHIANYRRLPAELVKQLVDNIRSCGYTPVWFGTRASQAHLYQNDQEIEGVLRMPDLSLRQLAACYSVIGWYVGSDSGDHHLMLAVGGGCSTFVPPSTWFYDHKKHHYGAEAWAVTGEESRETYHVFEREMPTILS